MAQMPRFHDNHMKSDWVEKFKLAEVNDCVEEKKNRLIEMFSSFSWAVSNGI